MVCRQNEMQNFTTMIVDMVKKDKLFASLEGPIIFTHVIKFLISCYQLSTYIVHVKKNSLGVSRTLRLDLMSSR